MRSPEPTDAGQPHALAGTESAIAATERWIHVAVVGLGLCPFAAPVHARQAIRIAVSAATTPAALLDDLAQEAVRLIEADPAAVETTLLVHPGVLGDFAEYNRFLGRADRLLARTGLRGVLQIASFHPQYVFAGSAADDLGNCTNRSPFPTLQLLRESSIERAVAAFGDTRVVYRRNIERMRRLGHRGWSDLWSAPAETPRVPP